MMTFVVFICLFMVFIGVLILIELDGMKTILKQTIDAIDETRLEVDALVEGLLDDESEQDCEMVSKDAIRHRDYDAHLHPWEKPGTGGM